MVEAMVGGVVTNATRLEIERMRRSLQDCRGCRGSKRPRTLSNSLQREGLIDADRGLYLEKRREIDVGQRNVPRLLRCLAARRWRSQCLPRLAWWLISERGSAPLQPTLSSRPSAAARVTSVCITVCAIVQHPNPVSQSRSRQHQ